MLRGVAKMSLRRLLALATACVLACTLACANAAVLGIDYGTEWFTIALANPGRPLDLVLNRDANRQTASVVTVNGLERTFGSNAVSIAPRMPEKTFMAVRGLLGVPFESEVAAAYRRQFPNKMVRDPATGGVAFEGSASNDTILTVTEIVAMQLRYAQQLVEEAEGIVVRDAVLTVPSFFDQAQRHALLDAASLAGLRVLALVGDGSAVALNYAMSRSFERAERHLFYDMGAGKTAVTVAGFHTRSAGNASKTKKPMVITVQAYAADSMLGGQELDFIVRDILADRFAARNSVSVAELKANARAMTRLLKEAKRVKTILSVNAEATASVEGLHGGIDFRSQISRRELEQATASLAPRIRAPVDRALAAANLTMSDIRSIVLVGGGSRVPFVQQVLAEAYGGDKLTRNVNSEEACVMGAVFKGATLSSLFRVRDMRLRDALQYAVRATYSTEPSSLLGRAKEETLLLFPEFGAVGARRTIRDTRNTDLAIAFESMPSGSEDKSWSPLASVRVAGITEAAAQLKSKSVVSEKPEVKVMVQTNDLGAFEVVKAEALFNVMNPGYAPYLEDLAAWEAESAAVDATSAASESDGAKSKTKLRARPVALPETITEVVRLALDVEYHGASRMNKSALEQSRSLLRRMDEDDAARSARHGAANRLESLIYRLRDEVEEDDFAAVTTEDQRAALEKALADASEWLENNAEGATVDELAAELAALKTLWGPIAHRKRQRAKRAESVSALRKAIAQAGEFVSAVRKELASVESDPDVKLLEGVDGT
ncbi:lumenal Hsp70 protein, partial [Coemansia biformis]